MNSKTIHVSCVSIYFVILIKWTQDTHCIDLYLNIANKNAFVNAKTIHVDSVSVYFCNFDLMDT